MRFIPNVLIGELLILILLIVVVFRPLFKKKRLPDSFAVVSLLAFCLSVLFLFVFEATLLLLIIAGLSFIVFLTNGRALQRFFNGLYVDRYSISFTIVSYIQGVLIVIFIILCIIFQPVLVDESFYTTELYTGSFLRGFTKKIDVSRPVNLVLSEYSAKVDMSDTTDSSLRQADEILVVFLSDVGTMVQDSDLRLMRAAEMGLDIISGDFYAGDMPKTGTDLDSGFFSSQLMKSLTLHFLPPLDAATQEVFLQIKEKELEALLFLAGQRSNFVVVVAEGLAREAALNMQYKYPDFIVSVFDGSENNTYYKRGIADLAFTSPFDALFSSFDGFSGYGEYKEFREFAKKEEPARKFAELLFEHVQNSGTGGTNDTF